MEEITVRVTTERKGEKVTSTITLKLGEDPEGRPFVEFEPSREDADGKQTKRKIFYLNRAKLAKARKLAAAFPYPQKHLIYPSAFLRTKAVLVDW